MGSDPDYDFAASIVAGLAARVLADGLPPNTLLSVNFPALAPAGIRGIEVTRLGKRVYRDVLIRHASPPRATVLLDRRRAARGRARHGNRYRGADAGLRLGDAAESGYDG